MKYAEWLTSRLSHQVFNGVVEISTPLLDPFNDGMRVYVEDVRGETILHDGGITFENLRLRGLDIESTDSRKQLIANLLRSSGANQNQDRIEVLANNENLPQRVHLLLMAMNRISDLYTTAQPKGSSQGLFLGEVRNFLDEHRVLYSTNLTIPGRTVQHPMDFVIPLPQGRDRLVKLIGTPSPSTAKVTCFTWMEISEARPDSERVVLINDEFSNSHSKSRSLSQQTEAILRGYSTAVYRWSKRHESEFNAFWLVAASGA